ncbi:MAG TPA: hypothetical protein VLX91_02825 [Candidatus Acidoferrales bacterium]|nr:hypothetical protein [Candidatus Acidoferrales bacterium]
MNPQDLIAPSSPLGNPAPFWFITFFKVLGFILHMIPMNIWYAGMLIVAVFGTFGKNHAEELSHRLSRSMPIIVAMGVNLGIVPLLFTQVSYYQFYYPAGVLIGWPWLSVIFLLVFAYYGVYVYSLNVRNNRKTKFAVASAWVSSILFIIIGFLFANNFSLMVNVNEWTRIFERTNAAGAVTGQALNISDPTLFPRWLMMFGIAMMTTAVYIVFDAFYFRKDSTSSGYKAWAIRFAFGIFTFAAIWFAVTGSWYIFGALDEFTLTRVGNSPSVIVLFIFTALSPGAPWLAMLLMFMRVKSNLLPSKSLVATAALAQFVVITLNAISRQWVQNTELSRFRDITTETVNTQWSPMIIFLLLFVAGLGVVGWMISKVMAIDKAAVSSRG